MSQSYRLPTLIIISGPGHPPAGPNGTPLARVSPAVLRKYASSKPLFRPKQPRGWKDESPPEST
jgi:hypothetical protein